ncbi:MAG: DUF389 domain-containing protein [Candidatus Pacebacteria bacterium]|nr:DUF389 domain-containing protein [Candidatus Paceibacterota bacterium]
MKLFGIARGITHEDKIKLVETIRSKTNLDTHYFVMIIVSVGLATCGILLDSIPVLIASMIIAPLLYPILGLSLAVTVGSKDIMHNSLKVFGKSIFYALIVSIIITFLFGFQGVAVRTLVSFNYDLFLSILVAGFSGFIATYGMLHPQVSSSYIGVAIAVSLVPPLAAIGVGIALLDFAFMRFAASVFTVNVIGIVVSSIITFIVLNVNEKTVQK